MIGQTISHYKIFEKLGGGGMGIVYKAQDLKLDRMVALKFLPPELTRDPDAKTRFIHEAKAASALEHPNICTVFEIDEIEEQCFIAMSYCDGESLNKRIERQPLEIIEAINIIIQITQGLHQAHKKDMIHRDIKPANIMIMEDGTAKIVDFGLAKLARYTRLTQKGVSVGTIAYMSPEQTTGEDVDQRTDIWSLGVMFYEMISGQLPFKGDYDQAIIYSIVNEKPEFLKNIPEQVMPIIKKCLEKNPVDRFQNADELLSDLKSFHSQPSIESHRDQQDESITTKRKSLYRYGGLVVFIVLIGLVGNYFFSRPGTSIDSIAVLPLESLSNNPEHEIFTAGMHEALITELSQIGALRTISRTSVMRYKETKKSIPEIASDLDVAAVVEGSVLHSGQKVRIIVQLIGVTPERHLWAQTFDRDIGDVLALHSEVARRIADQIQIKITQAEEIRLKTSVAVNSAAYEAYLLGRHYGRMGWTRNWKAIEYFTHAIEIDSTFAPGYAGLARAYAKLGSGYNILSPQESWPPAKKAAEKAIALDDELAEAHLSLAILKRDYEWDWNGAEREFIRAMELNPNSVEVLTWYGSFLGNTGRADESAEILKKRNKLDPYSIEGQRSVINSLYISGQKDEAITLNNNKIISEPEQHIWYWNLALLYTNEGRYNDAIDQIQNQIPLMKGDIVDEIALLGHLYGRTGHKKDAFKMMEQLDSLSEQGGYISPVLKAWIYSGLDDHDNAIYWLIRGYETRAHRMGLDLINFSKIFDPIHEDSRFKELLKKMNLEPCEVK
jgi:serine/threonine-protein kinase